MRSNEPRLGSPSVCSNQDAQVADDALAKIRPPRSPMPPSPAGSSSAVVVVLGIVVIINRPRGRPALAGAALQRGQFVVAVRLVVHVDAGVTVAVESLQCPQGRGPARSGQATLSGARFHRLRPRRIWRASARSSCAGIAARASPGSRCAGRLRPAKGHPGATGPGCACVVVDLCSAWAMGTSVARVRAAAEDVHLPPRSLLWYHGS